MTPEERTRAAEKGQVIQETGEKMGIVGTDGTTQTKHAPFTHDADILICAVHRIVQLFKAGSTWADVDMVIAKHRREQHAGDAED